MVNSVIQLVESVKLGQTVGMNGSSYSRHYPALIGAHPPSVICTLTCDHVFVKAIQHDIAAR